MRIRTMLIFIIACFSLASMAFFTVFQSENVSASAEKQYKKMVTEVAEKQSQAVQILFNYLDNNFSLVAGCPELKDYILLNNADEADNKKMVETLETYIQHNFVNSYTIYNDKKEILATTDPDIKAFFESSAFEETEKEKIAVYAGPEGTINSMFKLAARKSLGGGYYLLGIFNSESMVTIFKRAVFPLNGRIIFIDTQNQLIDTVFVGNMERLNSPEYTDFKKYIFEQGFTTGIEIFKYDFGRNARIACLTNIADTGWKIGVIGEAEKTYTYSNIAKANMFNCLIFLGVIFVVGSIILIVIITKPLYVIEETLLRIKRGDHEARINVTTKNEFGEIAEAFNNLLDNVIVSESRYRTILEMSDNIIFEWNFQNNNVIFSNNFNKKFSYRAPSDSFEDSFLVKCKLHPDDAERYKKDLEKLKNGNAFRQNEYRWKNVYGDYIWILMRTSAIKKQNSSDVLKIVGVVVDIDRAKKSEKMLTSRASFDALTELYNRQTVESLINNEIELIDARKNQFAILFVDVDDFKQYNDNYSHATGDQVLKFVASSINEIVSQFGIAGRYGGDEFVICIRNSEINDPSKAAQDILDKLKDGFVCDVGDRLTVAVSIGIAIIRDSSRRVDEIIGMADDAMYRIKKSGKASYGFISE